MKKGMDYIPISCHYHDELEALATHRKTVEIIFYDRSSQKSVESRITDFITRAKEEFLVLENGRHIRLDHLISVDGLLLADHKEC